MDAEVGPNITRALKAGLAVSPLLEPEVFDPNAKAVREALRNGALKAADVAPPFDTKKGVAVAKALGAVYAAVSNVYADGYLPNGGGEGVGMRYLNMSVKVLATDSGEQLKVVAYGARYDSPPGLSAAEEAKAQRAMARDCGTKCADFLLDPQLGADGLSDSLRESLRAHGTR
jgi:hypothetical protein